MRSITRWIWLAFLILAIGAPAVAGEAGVPVLQGRVNDYAGVLGAQAASIEAKLAGQERATGNQVVVLTVPDLGGQDIESYANNVFHAWKLGRKGIDDGVLIVLAVKDRRSRIEVGYGLEGTLTDLASSRIQRELMRPRFVAGDYAGGMDAGVEVVLAVLAGQEPMKTPVRDAEAWAPWWAFILPLIVSALLSLLAAAFGGWKILCLPMLCQGFMFAMAPWPVALAILLAFLAGIFGLRRRWMRKEFLRRTKNGRRPANSTVKSWPPQFTEVWRWPGSGQGRRVVRGADGSTTFWVSSSDSGSSSSSSDGFSGGGGDSGGGGSSDSW